MTTTSSDEIAEFLGTGQHDPRFSAWPGSTVFDSAQRGSAELRSALIAEVLRRTSLHRPHPVPDGFDPEHFARQKFSSMVVGLFAATERETVLSMLSQSVVFLTPKSIASVLQEMPWLSTAWDLANLYLESCEVALLSNDAPQLLGLSVETTCYVSCDYFRCSSGLDDYVIHEAAHIFHNCKREPIGLGFGGRREWLLDIAFGKRETFAYCCEAYSRLLEHSGNRRQRRNVLAEHSEAVQFGDDRVDREEYLDILTEAVSARNGWKRILARCQGDKPRRPTVQAGP